MPSAELLHAALDDAFRVHFAKLFEVLLVEPGEAAVERFIKGLTKTGKMYDRIHQMIDHVGSD
jgi:hypothetical protein